MVTSNSDSMVSHVEEFSTKIKLRLCYGGSFEQAAGPTSSYRYMGGEFYNESVPSFCKYADFMFKLSEKFKVAVSAKYQAPGEELDPQALITVGDDDDLREMFEEYASHLLRPGTPSKTFRIKLFVFAAAEEPLTPDEIMDGENFFSVRPHPMQRLRHDSSQGRSSWGSTLSSSETPSARPINDADALWHSGMSAALPDAVDMEADALAVHPGWAAAATAGLMAPLDAAVEKQALGNMRLSVNNLGPWGRYGFGSGGSGGGGALPLPPAAVLPLPAATALLRGRRLEQDLLAVVEVAPVAATFVAAAAAAARASGLDSAASGGYEAPDASMYDPQEMGFDASEIAQLEEGVAAAERELLNGSSGGGARPMSSAGMPKAATLAPEANDAVANGAVPNTAGAEGNGSAVAVAQLPADPWDMTDGDASQQATTTAADGAEAWPRGAVPGQRWPEDAGAAGVAALPAAGAGNALPPQAVSRLPSHISEFGDNGSDDGMPIAAADEAVAAAGGASAGARAAGGARAAALQRVGSHDSVSSLGALRGVARVAKSDVRVTAAIGEGAFGEVSLAVAPLYGTVAVKWLKNGRFSKHSKSFWHEAGMLAELNHPNVLRFYGVVTEGHAYDSPVIGIMTEYVRGGSLVQYLRASAAPIPLAQRCQLALHATNGLAYLHELRVVHFDLKPDNLLLEAPSPGAAAAALDAAWHAGSSGGGVGTPHSGVSNGAAGAASPADAAAAVAGAAAPVLKVADFGLSKHKLNSYVSNCRDLRGTLPYMAPELVADPERVSEKADVWSMGVVMWEMLTREPPYHELQPQQILMGLMCGNLSLDVPEWCEPEWRGLLEAALEPNPAARPSMREMAVQLEAILGQQQQQQQQLHAGAA